MKLYKTAAPALLVALMLLTPRVAGADESDALLQRGIQRYGDGDFKASLEALNRSHEIGLEGKWAHRQVFTNLALGNVHCMLRDFETARRHLHTGYSQAQSLGFPREEALALEFLGDVCR